MKLNIYLILFLFFSVLLMSSCNMESTEYHSFRQNIMKGDSSIWSSVEYDDSHWKGWYEEGIESDEIFWIRYHYTNHEPQASMKGKGVLIGATGSYEVFWNGVFLGRNGRLQSPSEKEIQGTYQAFFAIPDTLLKSKDHVLSMRTTMAQSDLSQHSYYELDDYFKLTRGRLQVSKYMFMIGGIFFITALYFFFLFAGQPKEYSILIFAIICLAFLSILLLEYLKLYHQYPYPFQRTRLQWINYLHIFICVLMPSFFMLQFGFPWKKWIIGALAICIIVIEFFLDIGYDHAAIYLNMVMWVFSLGIVGYAFFQKKKGTEVVLIGFVASLLVVLFVPFYGTHFVSSFDINLFVSFMLIVISMIYLMIQKRQDERKAYEESLVVSERLKNQLLKKNIKPHFIMNTLTSLIDWVEESPKEGVKFIHALANEFEVLNEIADYTLIPIDQETKLCKRHLEVMGFRKEISYIWEEEGIDHNDIIPPAVIHTAVENGVSHSLPNADGSIQFKLSFTREKRFKEYKLQTVAKIRKDSTFDEIENENGDGMGLKYIKARLQESYPNKWSLSSDPTTDGWETIIRISE